MKHIIAKGKVPHLKKYYLGDVVTRVAFPAGVVDVHPAHLVESRHAHLLQLLFDAHRDHRIQDGLPTTAYVNLESLQLQKGGCNCHIPTVCQHAPSIYSWHMSTAMIGTTGNNQTTRRSLVTQLLFGKLIRGERSHHSGFTVLNTHHCRPQLPRTSRKTVPIVKRSEQIGRRVKVHLLTGKLE